MDMNSLTPEERDRFERATLSLRVDQLSKELERAKKEQWDPVTIRDMSICWAFIVSAAASLESSLQLMPDSVEIRRHVSEIMLATKAIAFHLQEAIESIEEPTEDEQ